MRLPLTGPVSGPCAPSNAAPAEPARRDLAPGLGHPHRANRGVEGVRRKPAARARQARALDLPEVSLGGLLRLELGRALDPAVARDALRQDPERVGHALDIFGRPCGDVRVSSDAE